MNDLLKDITPGCILKEEFMEPYNLSANALAHALGIPPNRITSIISNKRSISADTALRLGLFFETTPEFWVNLQKTYDLRVEKVEKEEEIKHTVTPLSVFLKNRQAHNKHPSA